MERKGQSYSSGEWLVRAGSEDEFVDRWIAFIEWTSDNAAGAVSFVLVRSIEDPRKFLSLGAWESQQAQSAWRAMPRMQELLGRCRELCEESESHSYALAASRGGPRSSTERVAGTVQEGATATGRAASGLLGAATGAVGDLTGSAAKATASGAERAAETVAFPIGRYDEMNVEEISGRLKELSVEELQVVRDYEELHEGRKTLLEEMDRKIRSAS